MMIKNLSLSIGTSMIIALMLYGCNGFISDVTVTSSAITNGDYIPVTYSCDGANDSPPLSFSVDNNVSGIQSITIIIDDPDAPGGTFVHSVAFNLPGGMTEISEGFFSGAMPIEFTFNTGINDFGNNSYNGPCPPPGQDHRYYFRVYLLDTTLNLPDGSTRQQVDLAMLGHIVAKGELMGRFSR